LVVLVARSLMRWFGASEGDRLPMPSMPTALAGVHRALLRARLPVLCGAVAVAAGTLIWWHVEDPMMVRRVKG
jgi:hypothetical protein